MRKVLVLPLVAAIALAGCSSQEEEAPGAEGGEAGGGGVAAIAPDPGLYRINVEIAELSFPGMPAGMTDQLKQSMTSNFALEDCLTEADRQDAVKKMTKGAENGSCTYTKYDVSGGRIDAVMSCKNEQGGEGNFTMKGAITTTGVDMTMEGDQQQPGMPGGGMHMKMRLKSERIGECKAKA